MKIKKFKNLLFFIVLTLMVSFYAPTVYSETVKDTTYIGVTSDIHHKIPNLEK